jgi:MarR family transcriptional regulator, organic hydroperoxide resistance regulator
MSSQNKFLKAMEKWINIYFQRSLTEYFDFLKNSGVSMQQAYALTFIHYNGPSNISELCDHMMVSAPAASQLADRLEKLGFVQRMPKPGDRRVRNVVLTDQGEIFVKESIEARQSWVYEIPPVLSDEQLDQISESFQLLASSYQEEIPN